MTERRKPGQARAPTGRLIAFEGVDGAGKTTALALLVERLRQRGERVFVPRMGKHHSSRPVRVIRDLTRDRRHLELDPRTELLLYCAREAQVLAELVAPALRDGCTVLIDRSLLTPVVLGRARGLPRETCEQAATAAAAGLQPDLTLVFDVHPRTSRLRKRIERIRNHSDEEGGRKGLAGSAFKERVRDLYTTAALEHGYPLLHAERATPAELAERALRLIDHGAQADLDQSALERVPLWMSTERTELPSALERLPPVLSLYFGAGLLCAREQRRRLLAQEPALCAATLDPEDPLREPLAEVEPDYVLHSDARRPLAGALDLRIRLLARHPAACIRALKHHHDRQADAIRELYADEHPDAVVESLQGRQDAQAQRLRERCWQDASDRARAESLIACRGEAAWREREALLERDPVLGLHTLIGLCEPRAQRWLERYAAVAPKAVLAALAGRSDEQAHRLREAWFATGREVIDSLRGLDDEPSWALRERALQAWPSTVAHSLLGLESRPRAQAMIERCRELGAGDLHLQRRLQQLAERPLWPRWALTRAGFVGLDEVR
jgi:dTMP kinase